MGNALHRGSATLHPCLCYVALTGLYIGTLTTQGLRPYGLTPACVLSPLQGYISLATYQNWMGLLLHCVGKMVVIDSFAT